MGPSSWSLILVLLAGHLPTLSPTGSHSFYQNKDRETFTSLAMFFCLGQLSYKSGVFQLQNMETGNWQLAARCHCPSLGEVSFANFWVATVSIWSECHWVPGEGYLMHSVNMTVTIVVVWVRNVLYCLGHLNTWTPGGGSVWVGFQGVALLK